MGITLALLAAWTVFTPAPASPPPAPALPDTDQIARELGYTKQDLQEILAGRIVAVSLDDSTKKELAMTLSMLIRAPISRLVDLVQDQAIFKAQKIVLSFGSVPEGRVSAGTFADLRLPPEEVEKLSEAGPGSAFNLSSAEIRSLRDAAPRGPSSVMDAYRELLAQRLNAYRKGGIRAMAPYDRGRGKTSSPADQMRASTEAMGVLKKYMPHFYAAFLNYPEDPAPNLKSSFFWSLEKIQDRPTAVLVHRMVSAIPDRAMMLERQFYVGQSYNCLELVVGAIHVKQGSLVFYINRTNTDQVAGFASSAAHKIGKRVMEKQLRENFEEVRRAFEKP